MMKRGGGGSSNNNLMMITMTVVQSMSDMSFMGTVGIAYIVTIHV